MIPSRKIVYLADSDQLGRDGDMRFRLTYEGPLNASQGDPRGQQAIRKADHKQEIRKHFHPQLKRLWETDKFLKEQRMFPGQHFSISPSNSQFGFGGGPQPPLMVETVANAHAMFGYKFVPLVVNEWTLACSLNVLFLRKDAPGSVFTAGDIDNRIKTLIDGLRVPNNSGELGAYQTPGENEEPFFCLLRDDKSITAFSVDTDVLLGAPPGSDNSYVRLVITVDIRPYFVTMFNLGFAS